MPDNQKQSQSDNQNSSEHRTVSHILKELLTVCIWIVFGAFTLWGADGFGLLFSSPSIPYDVSSQVDFPEVYQIWQSNDAVFVDARSTGSFHQGHIPGAINVPINRVVQYLHLLPTDKKTLLITYCGSITCPNAYQLMNVLNEKGYQNVKFFPRGLRDWQVLGYPLETK